MKTPSMIPRSRCIDPASSRRSESPEAFSKWIPHKDNEKRYAVRDFLTAHFQDYCNSHPVPEYKLRIVNSMIACKTGRLGYTLINCDTCGRTEMRACACGNRNCPSCGVLEEKRWVALRQSEVIPGIPYFHLVFTLPHDLHEIMFQNQKETLSLLFRSVKDTIFKLSEDKLKMTPGIMMILHTFGSSLSLHYHLHYGKWSTMLSALCDDVNIKQS